jgi:hypothetical protein
MAKDFGKHWSIYFNPNSLHNWGLGFNYYHEYESTLFVVVARICQIDLIFFNITITRWSNQRWI